MVLNGNSDILSVILPDCYLIYMGDDNEKYPVIEMLKSQPVFLKSSFICRKPVVDKDDVVLSKDKWNISHLVKYNSCLLIFADLKIEEYFYELTSVCKELDSRKDEIIIIVINDDHIIHGELRFQYEDLIKNHYVIELSLKEYGQVLQESLKYVLFQQAIHYDFPTIKTFMNELEGEFSLKYIK